MALTEVDGTTAVLVEKDGSGGHKLAVVAGLDAGTTVGLEAGSEVIGAVEFVDESGVAYGVKHVDNKLRVSATPYFIDIVEGNVPAHTAVNKFGHNSAVGATLEAVWDYGGAYTYLADDTFATMYLSSDAAADTSMLFNIQGIDDEYNFFSADATTDASDGRTFVQIDTGSTGGDAWRIFRVINLSAKNQTGNIYISKDNTDAGGNGIPDTVTNIQAQVKAYAQQTLMSLWTVPLSKTAYLTRIYASTSTAKVSEIHLYVRPFGGVFNIKYIISLNANVYSHVYDFPISVAAKSDIKVMASAAGGGGEISAGFDLWYE